MSMKQRILILPLGIPGSGKTTFCDNYFKVNNIPCVSSDYVRKEMYGDESIQGSFDDVFNEVYRQVNDRLDECGICVLDATNITKWARSQAIRRTHPTEVYYVLMNNNLKRAKRQNKQRERCCPEYVIDSMHFKLQNNFPKKKEFKNLTILKYDDLALLDKIKEWSDFNGA